MDGDARGAQEPPLIPEIDPSARVVYAPVRHHSPACAFHVGRLIREVRPDAVLIEGPRDASRLIHLLTHPETRMPVAIYTTYVRREAAPAGPEGPAPKAQPVRHAAYYPLCDYSPELAAIRAAAELGVEARFIDLTYPEMVEAGRTEGAGRATSLQEERPFSHSDVLREAGRRVGARDPDDLWDHLYEIEPEAKDTPTFFRDVLAYCALARLDSTPEGLEADGTLRRERAMAAAIADQPGRVVVVTGGFHTVALPTTRPEMPPRVKVDDKDALVALMRYGFEQLDRLNGYASGMPAPEFYQRAWEKRPATALVVELAREARKRRQPVSIADEIAALEQVRRLAMLRGHAAPSREDLSDGIRSVFVKGADDVEGLPILAMLRKLLAGDRVGQVPPDAGVPPLVEDFRRTAARLKVDLDRVEAREVALDLYRGDRARQTSRLFHRLRFLTVPFAEWVSGPDYVTGEHLERIREVWKYRWTPAVESTLIERSLYGSTLEEASAALLMEQFAEAEANGQGRRADRAANLLLEACRMGLHQDTPRLLERTSRLVAEDGQFVSIVKALEQLLVLHVSREPLEAHHLEGVTALADAADSRACYLIPELAGTGEAEEKEVLDALNALPQAALALGDDEPRRSLRNGRLRALMGDPACRSVLHGAAAGLLFGAGEIAPEELVRELRGHLQSVKGEGHEGAAFLRGLLGSARSVLWLVPEVLDQLHEVIRSWDEDRFVAALPELRLAFSDLTPRECDQVAQRVVGVAGSAGSLSASGPDGFGEADLLRGVAVNRLVLDVLREDGLEEVLGA
ncbi:hypothetical protein OJF2_11350 [Aquisphaera giovannonii]|uniref:Uncharacterized protein n=1 Tax=Aquisphaera giovannonii TaxID=406548 RepID=A0A5B9VW23_9BACT|nr:DUF5682 family protein [Aquisphaera giovannonii]QEH32656.1 hypothetical protein OJF2_11350 [Aquisphaera giovannonii]